MFERGRRNRNVNYSAFHIRDAPSLNVFYLPAIGPLCKDFCIKAKESLCIFLLKLLSYKMTIGRFCCDVLSLSLVVVLQEGAAVLAVLLLLL